MQEQTAALKVLTALNVTPLAGVVGGWERVEGWERVGGRVADREAQDVVGAAQGVVTAADVTPDLVDAGAGRGVQVRVVVAAAVAAPHGLAGAGGRAGVPFSQRPRVGVQGGGGLRGVQGGVLREHGDAGVLLAAVVVAQRGAEGAGLAGRYLSAEGRAAPLAQGLAGRQGQQAGVAADLHGPLGGQGEDHGELHLPPAAAHAGQVQLRDGPGSVQDGLFAQPAQGVVPAELFVVRDVQPGGVGQLRLGRAGLGAGPGWVRGAVHVASGWVRCGVRVRGSGPGLRTRSLDGAGRDRAVIGVRCGWPQGAAGRRAGRDRRPSRLIY